MSQIRHNIYWMAHWTCAPCDMKIICQCTQVNYRVNFIHLIYCLVNSSRSSIALYKSILYMLTVTVYITTWYCPMRLLVVRGISSKSHIWKFQFCRMDSPYSKIYIFYYWHIISVELIRYIYHHESRIAEADWGRVPHGLAAFFCNICMLCHFFRWKPKAAVYTRNAPRAV